MTIEQEDKLVAALESIANSLKIIANPPITVHEEILNGKDLDFNPASWRP